MAIKSQVSKPKPKLKTCPRCKEENVVLQLYWEDHICQKCVDEERPAKQCQHCKAYGDKAYLMKDRGLWTCFNCTMKDEFENETADEIIERIRKELGYIQ